MKMQMKDFSFKMKNKNSIKQKALLGFLNQKYIFIFYAEFFFFFRYFFVFK